MKIKMIMIFVLGKELDFNVKFLMWIWRWVIVLKVDREKLFYYFLLVLK